ncbi:hypothetical protein ACFQH2_09700 [Natronoarchaeum sp. GCM10025703]|uniref:hypothetical protein n=1 Tax=Natronoarchaeum sp. GCM10025703 TaxID=3252685 RepID=UPI003607C8ED
MSPDDTPDPYGDYAELLREIGIPDEETRSLHVGDGHDVADQPLLPFLEDRVESSAATDLARKLVDVLTQSRRGMSATGSYWNYAPEVHLNEVFEPYGCSVTFQDASHGDGQSSFEVILEDASGTGHRTTFEYPETPLGDDNFPALLAAIERRLLSNTDLTFVLLTPIDRRWRVLMIEHARLDHLRSEYGERIKFAGLPLLREDQLEAFERGEATTVKPQSGETMAGTDRDPSTAHRRTHPDAADGSLARITSVDDGPTPDPDSEGDPGAVFAGSPDDLAAQAGEDAGQSKRDGMQATDGELNQVFGDLSGVSLEPIEQETDNDGPVEESVDIGERTESEAEAEPDGLDDLFEQIEREALTDEDSASPAGPGDSTAVAATAGEAERY